MTTIPETCGGVSLTDLVGNQTSPSDELSKSNRKSPSP